VGLLGSRPKVVHIFAALQEQGLTPDELGGVHAPLGLEIGAQTPEEIAVSILAEMIAVRRGVDPALSRSMKMGLPGRMSAGREPDTP
jgi:xanthine dehydrogenase accessory factor